MGICAGRAYTSEIKFRAMNKDYTDVTDCLWGATLSASLVHQSVHQNFYFSEAQRSYLIGMSH